MFGDGRKLFDLSTEKDEVREKYGRNTFGQSCLMARRLVEQGVPYITINYKGWDRHKQHFQAMRRKLPEVDAGMASLLQDLSDRGLLDSTIIWWSGEFGRGPKVQWGSPWNGGRSHYGKCFSALIAGGGFKGGHVVGASDEKGMEVADRPVYPEDLLGSMYELLGIDPDGPLPNPRGMDLKVMPSTEESGGRLREIV
jgi:arylsulfatase A-like enzyme